MHGFAWGLILTRRRFKKAVLTELAEQYGEQARVRAEIDLTKPDRLDIYGVAEEAGVDTTPANAERVADLYARRVGVTSSRSTTS